MNTKELGEIKRRVRRDRSNMSTIYGCYVGSDKKIISEFKASIGTMPENEAEKYFALFKKVLSGTIGKTIHDITFSTKQVAAGEEHHALLTNLQRTAASDDTKRNELYQQIVEAIDLESNYLILLGCDTYDVPFKTKDDETQAECSEESFTYLLCAICPVKETAPNLHYVHDEKAFHDGGMIHAVNKPAMGFMFPAFDGRATNIYGALLYGKDTSKSHQELVGAVFGTGTPEAADEQKSSFDAILSAAMGSECNMELVQSLHEQAWANTQLHKEAKVPEILTVDRNGVERLLSESGASSDKINDLGDAFEAKFGMNAEVPLGNIIDTKHYVIKTLDATIKIAPDRTQDVLVRKIGGIPYVCVVADGGIEVNGIQLSADDIAE
jgi:hypothetical protein